MVEIEASNLKGHLQLLLSLVFLQVFLNAVEAGIVEKPEDYLYSSAKDYVLTKKCGLLDVVFL